jgi:phage terminase small subunit
VGTKDRKLTEQQLKFVELYCDPENTETFLNHRESYIQAGYKDKVNPASKATKLLNQDYIKAAIRKDMPKVAYSEYILRREYWELYGEAKEANNYTVAAKLLDSMAKTERMFVSKDAEDNNGKIADSIVEATKETMEKLKAIKEGKVVEFKKDGTD